MELLALCWHPLWVPCTLVLSVVLWARRAAWRPAACPVDLRGKTAVVTGANSGLPLTVTPEGLSLIFATNYLGHFLLTNLLLDAMKASAPSRIVNVSSFRHQAGEANVQFLSGKEQPKNFNKAYNSTKLMNVLFTVELARRLQGTGVTVNALSPGMVHTEIMQNFSWWVRLLFHLVGILFLKSPTQGSFSTTYCAVSEEVEGISGKYFDSDCRLALPSPLARDPAVGRKLWEASEKLVGLHDGGREPASRKVA
ncbi:Hypothetical predicted protein [Podarcis lilfordi]|uniref:Uncharacterized protein n=1 Tax=Podarcis lilfordi TaxID=74358 RepID=A0AA35PGX2_9SAUR|nr:Hypothetical predicted protein [Podarcis lilfordi]